MAGGKSDDTVTMAQFRAALRRRLGEFTKSQTDAAKKLGMQPYQVNALYNKGASIAVMEEVAEKLGVTLLKMLNEGEAILAGLSVASSQDEGLEPPKVTALKAEIVALKDENGQLKDKLLAAQDKIVGLLERGQEAGRDGGETPAGPKAAISAA